ncbi:protein phosphatase [Micromonospora sp. NPDC023644]|uniref:protein-tyrosine phosphatase family protein n=1 Tax=Micromonospora sp. NPDC023644 TaxID=3154321 RepID=UPI0033D1CC69
MKDRHWRTPYSVAGLTVWGTSLDSADRRAAVGTAKPADLGVYLDDRWLPEADAHQRWFLTWPTLDAPPQAGRVVAALAYVLERLRLGDFVEIACFGGHGRTGTAIACLDVLAGASPADAVARMRREYCPYAIGSDELAAFVHDVPRLRARPPSEDDA